MRAISGRAQTGKEAGCLAAFLWLFLLVGAVALYFTFLRPAAKILEARSWKETPCVIVSSRVLSHRGDDSDTFSVDILYAYEVDGKEYRANRYLFLGGSSSGYKGKARVVARHAPGTRIVCYVKPNVPTEAVLVRDFTPAYLVGLIPLVFVLAGAGGILLNRRAARRRPAKDADAVWLPSAASTAPAGISAVGSTTLKPKATPVAKLAGAIVISAFWNGVVGVFVWRTVGEWRAGDPDWLRALFLVPFVLAGLLTLVWIVYQFLALFNPRPYLTLGTASPRLGGTIPLDWRFTGATSRIERLSIFLEGREEATYRRGKQDHTERAAFATLPIVDTVESLGIAAGSARVTVPEGTMHSFEAPRNKVVWALKVRGEIRSWPDVDEEFELTIRPKPLSAEKTE